MVFEVIKKTFKTIGWAVAILCKIFFLWVCIRWIKTGKADVEGYILLVGDGVILIMDLIFNPYTQKLRKKRKSKEVDSSVT